MLCTVTHFSLIVKLANKCEQGLGEKIRQINEIYLSSVSISTDIE